MRVFVYELVSAGALAGASAALRGEGAAMLAALVEDFAACAGTKVCTLLDGEAEARLGGVSALAECHRAEGCSESDLFRRLAGQADFSVVIAPEFEGLLATRSQWVIDVGGRLLGSPPGAVSRVSDKANLERTLRAAGVLTPSIVATLPPTLPAGAMPAACPLVCKPRFGAGCRGVRVAAGVDAVVEAVASARAAAPGVDLLLQPFVSGLHASAALLCGPARVLPLSAGLQQVCRDGDALVYQGGTLPLGPRLLDRALRAAANAVACFPDLAGFCGVDLVLGDQDDGAADHVIEINPRPTTSYVGLRHLCRANLAEVWLRLARGQVVEAPRWHAGRIAFTVEGKIMNSRGASDLA